MAGAFDVIARVAPLGSDERGSKCEVNGTTPVRAHCPLPPRGRSVVSLFVSEQRTGRYHGVAQVFVDAR
jgi:hypothetical protein